MNVGPVAAASNRMEEDAGQLSTMGNNHWIRQNYFIALINTPAYHISVFKFFGANFKVAVGHPDLCTNEAVNARTSFLRHGAAAVEQFYVSVVGCCELSTPVHAHKGSLYYPQPFTPHR